MLPHHPKGCNSTKVAGKHEKHVETVGETLFVGPFNILQQSFVRGFSIVFSIGFNSIGYRPEHRHFAAGASRLTKFVRENPARPNIFWGKSSISGTNPHTKCFKKVTIRLWTFANHPGNYLNMRASVSVFTGFLQTFNQKPVSQNISLDSTEKHRP